MASVESVEGCGEYLNSVSVKGEHPGRFRVEAFTYSEDFPNTSLVVSSSLRVFCVAIASQ
jgi:hypothetical protein